MATKFTADITTALTPSSADPGAAMAATSLKADAQSNAIKALGSTIWEGVQGYQGQSYRQEQQAYLDSLGSEMAGIKNADMINKGIAQETQDDPVLSVYREQQKTLAAARDQMPTRYKEFRTRSETLLREYIAKMPGMADKFRSIAKEVTGLNDVDTYSVGKLYEDISYIEKQQVDQAQALQKADADWEKAWINDAIKRGVPETLAKAQYRSTPMSARIKFAEATYESDQAKKAIDEQVKQGGTALLQVANTARAEWPSQLAMTLAPVYHQLEELGITRGTLASMNVVEIQNNPRAQVLLKQAASEAQRMLDARYVQITAALRSRMGGADSEKARQALADVDGWYSTESKRLDENSMGAALKTLAAEDPEKRYSFRLELLNKTATLLGVPPDVLTNLRASRDSTQYKEAATRYPMWDRAIKKLDTLSGAAANGTPSEEFMQLIKAKDRAFDDPFIPNGDVETAAVMVTQEDLLTRVRRAQQGGDKTQLPSDIAGFVKNSMTTPAGSAKALSTTPIWAEALKNIPEGEKSAVVEQVNSFAQQMLFGYQGHGDEAKQHLEAFRKADSRLTTAFKDTSGATPLAMASTGPTRAAIGRGGSQGVRQPIPVNNVLHGIDNVLRVQSIVSGVPVQQLRKDFMAEFSKEGMPSITMMQETTKAAETVTAPVAPVTSTDLTQDEMTAVNPKTATTDEEAVAAYIKNMPSTPEFGDKFKERMIKSILEGDPKQRQTIVDLIRGNK